MILVNQNCYISLDIECVLVSSSESELVVLWEVLLGLLDSLELQYAGESGIDSGTGSSASCCAAG